MNKKQYLQLHKTLTDKMHEITCVKNADYSGSGDDPFSNFRQIGHIVQKDGIEEIGFVTRMSDKMSRIGSFVSKGTLMVKDESVEDTLLDLANYCLLFIGYLRDKKERRGDIRTVDANPLLGHPYDPKVHSSAHSIGGHGGAGGGS